MHICQIVASWEHGGLEKHVIELSNELSKDHQVTVLAHPLMKQYFENAVHFVPVDFSRSRWSLSLHRDLIRILNQIKPNVIHAQANKAALLVKRVRPFVKCSSRFVATLHNQKDNTRMFEGFDNVIVVSPRLATLVKNTPITAIYNGVRLPSSSKIVTRQEIAQEFGLDAQTPILIAVGRLVDAKGFDVLIEAAAKAQVQLLIVGDGELKADLQKKINQLQATVVLAGFRQDVLRLMSATDGFILSSRHEGFAYVFVEALLSKRTIIATSIPMVKDFMPEELIVPIADVEALATKLKWAVSHLSQWQYLMQPSFSKAQNLLTLEAMAASTLAVYNL
ncbi:MAG TPA: glycosyltransferase family 4 protein [Agitococcus sp.]|nr:glycosyltransferase family 4 protein [Agitococcus sp.]